MIEFHGLENETVRLDLLDRENFLGLLKVSVEPDLLKYSPGKIHNESHLTTYVNAALEDYQEGKSIPLIIIDKRNNRVAGSTRFGKIDNTNSVLHIGWTWIGKDFQGTGLNTNMKYLMLKYAFEDLQFRKVEFRIDERNEQSRRAIEKIGAKLEGILRRNVLLDDGFIRNTCCYGILNSEWPEIKRSLENRINELI